MVFDRIKYIEENIVKAIKEYEVEKYDYQAHNIKK